MRNVVLLLLALFLICTPSYGQQKILLKKTGKTILAKKAAKNALEHQAQKTIAKQGFAKTGNAMLDQAGKKIMRGKIVKKASSQGCKSLQVYSKKAVRSQLPLRQLSKMRRFSTSAKYRYLKKSQLKAKHLQLKGQRYNVGAYGKFAYLRNGVCPSNQFISAKQYSRVNQGKITNLTLGQAKDAKILRDNMLAVMGPHKTKYIKLKNNAAHHLVGIDKELAPSYKKLKKYGIDINDPMNGIFLPTSETSVLKGTKHSGGHTRDYYNYVNSKFATANSKEDCYRVLDELKHELFEGVTPLYNPISNVVNL